MGAGAHAPARFSPPERHWAAANVEVRTIAAFESARVRLAASLDRIPANRIASAPRFVEPSRVHDQWVRVDFQARPFNNAQRRAFPRTSTFQWAAAKLTPQSESILDTIHHRKDRLLCAFRRGASVVNYPIVLAALTIRAMSRHGSPTTLWSYGN
jgi:hypothetical protein